VSSRGADDDPGPPLVALYRQVLATSMAGLPFLNPALEVEAVGFCRWQGDWLGAVITPWFINLFLLPGGGSAWSPLAPGGRRDVVFPAGHLNFIGDYDDAVGDYQSSPLFAPVRQFADQREAREAASVALAALFLDGKRSEDVPVAAGTADPAPSRRRFLRRIVAGNP
jgi:[NiFe] hydrogenase assembly HybE family chaperone